MWVVPVLYVASSSSPPQAILQGIRYGTPFPAYPRVCLTKMPEGLVQGWAGAPWGPRGRSSRDLGCRDPARVYPRISGVGVNPRLTRVLKFRQVMQAAYTAYMLHTPAECTHHTVRNQSSDSRRLLRVAFFVSMSPRFHHMFDSTHAATVSEAALCNIVRMYGYVRLPRRLCHPAASRAVQVTVIFADIRGSEVNPG